MNDLPTKVFQEGDAVIVVESISSKKLVFLAKGLKIQNKYGVFSHENIIGKPPGSKIFSKNMENYLIILEPNPVLITETLAHKTQILYEMDIAMILMKLNILPGSRVVESGTGSASLSYSISNAISPTGHLFTFEFNKDRHANAISLFHSLRITNTTVLLRDSCGFGFLPQNDGNPPYFLEAIDAVFLDLPKPWEAVVHAARVLKRNGKICCFSPCIEQVQRTFKALRANGFVDAEMLETLCRYFERKDRFVQGRSEEEEQKNEEIASFQGEMGEKVRDLQENHGESQEFEIKGGVVLGKSEEKNQEIASFQEEKAENQVKSKEKQENCEKIGKFVAKNKRKPQENAEKRSFFSTGQGVCRGHTGYLTFATFVGTN